MKIEFEFKNKYNIEDLLNIMRILRAPGGCPWDAEQTHESIKKNFIEETYEVVESINKSDPVLMCEELGDVLLQIVFHAQMEDEKGVFGFGDVADGICKKLIERHPHVFGDVSVSGTDEVLSNWDAIKRRTKKQKTTAQAMDSVPKELPALMRSTKIQAKAAKAGFDWADSTPVFGKLREETAELEEAVASGNSDAIADELGDVLFTAVNISRFVNTDAEEALTRATDKFAARFALVEKMASERGIIMKDTPLAELDKLWDEAKKQM